MCVHLDTLTNTSMHLYHSRHSHNVFFDIDASVLCMFPRIKSFKFFQVHTYIYGLVNEVCQFFDIQDIIYTYIKQDFDAV